VCVWMAVGRRHRHPNIAHGWYRCRLVHTPVQ
jgi:hypothetical protein